MKSFKFFNKEELIPDTMLVFNAMNTRFDPENVEFCFQFDENEPVVFATGPNECHISIGSSHNGNMIFNDNGRVFKLFARERENDAHV